MGTNNRWSWITWQSTVCKKNPLSIKFGFFYCRLLASQGKFINKVPVLLGSNKNEGNERYTI